MPRGNKTKSLNLKHQFRLWRSSSALSIFLTALMPLTTSLSEGLPQSSQRVASQYMSTTATSYFLSPARAKTSSHPRINCASCVNPVQGGTRLPCGPLDSTIYLNTLNKPGSPILGPTIHTLNPCAKGTPWKPYPTTPAPPKDAPKASSARTTSPSSLSSRDQTSTRNGRPSNSRSASTRRSAARSRTHQNPQNPGLRLPAGPHRRSRAHP